MDAEKAFLNYLKQYDWNDKKIHLKIVHTFGVVKAANYIAAGLGLGKEDRMLAELIALLHDIGRFEQLKRYHTFDDSVMPHAQCSIDILFGEGRIREFIDDPAFDSVIYNAIRLHGVYRVEDSMYRRFEWESPLLREEDLERLERTILHTKLIRDADKVDNFRVKSEEAVETMVDVTAKTLGQEAITPSIYDAFLSHTPILNADRKTHMDMWVSYLGYLFDMNFSSSFRYILEKDYINQIVDRIPYANRDTGRKMETVRREALLYAERRAGEGGL